MIKDKCPCCRGAKKVLKLGVLTGTCDTCDGKGYVEREPEKQVVTVQSGEELSITTDGKNVKAKSVKQASKKDKAESL
jgi:DnaJ-class molecular chaperone